MVSSEMVVHADQLVKRYGLITALAGASIQVGKGQLVSLLGANGSGKTTLVRCLLGLTTPNSGKLKIFGGHAVDRSTRMRVGTMLQVGKVPITLTVKEHVKLFSSYYPRPLPLRETLSLAGLAGLENRLFKKLSVGQKQRVMFALAICGDPDLLILDEPTAGLDVQARRTMLEIVQQMRERGKSILMTTHHLDEADALSDRITVLKDGAVLIEGSPSEIKARVLGKRIRCITTLATEEIWKVKGVNGVTLFKGVTQIETFDADKIVRELALRDPSISNLEIQSPQLEDVFLALVG